MAYIHLRGAFNPLRAYFNLVVRIVMTAVWKVGDIVQLAPDPNYPSDTQSDTQWKIVAQYKNASGLWYVGEIQNGHNKGDQNPILCGSNYQLVK